MDMNLMKRMAEMMLEELVNEGDISAIAMKALNDVKEKHHIVMSHFGGVIGNDEKSKRFAEFAKKINEQFDEFMKAEDIKYGNKNN